jgi:hypothetical protein
LFDGGEKGAAVSDVSPLNHDAYVFVP